MSDSVPESAAPEAHHIAVVESTGQRMPPRREQFPSLFLGCYQRQHGFAIGGLAPIASRIEGYIRPKKGILLSSLGYYNMDMPPADQHRAPTVLVVDDEDLVREMCRRILQPAGYKVMEASDGARALGLLMQGGVDAVVTDIRMPGMGGWELAGRLAMMSPRPAILFISGYDTHDGSTSFTGPLLAKPFRPEQLVSSVSQMLPASQPPSASREPTPQ